jgi:hypothetical protein
MATTNWTAVVARIKAQMETITNIGQVHDRRRLMTKREEFDAQALADINGEKRTRFWMISLSRMDDAFLDSGGSLRWDREAVIEGILQLEDVNSSELTADALAESVCRTLATDLRTTKLNGTVLTGRPPRIEVNEPRFFVFVVAHYIRIVFPLISVEQ